MQYVTTRNGRDRFTPQQVLREDRGADGGFFLPTPMPAFSQEYLKELEKLPFTGRIAQILNGLFDTNITQWDVDFCVGRHPVRVISLPQKIELLQCWHNRHRSFAGMVRILASRLRQDGEEIATEWVEIAVRLAILAARFAQSPESESVDVAVVGGELFGAASVWYAKNAGLPIGRILLCCNENSGMWELLHRGQLRTGALSVPTATPEADVAVPAGLERLLFAVAGTGEVKRYLEVCRRGGTYMPEEPVLAALREDLRVVVTGVQRMEAALRGVYANGILLSPYDGLCHGGILDYRAQSGENRPCLILSERSPVLDRRTVENAFCEGALPEDIWEEER